MIDPKKFFLRVIYSFFFSLHQLFEEQENSDLKTRLKKRIRKKIRKSKDTKRKGKKEKT